jgi:anti-sigma regulatory factor (Ser/Thr protein kinase)
VKACLNVDRREDVVPAVRCFVKSSLQAWRQERFADDATLIVSELLTNAVLHAGAPITVAMAAEEGTLRVEVYDGDGHMPAVAASAVDATNGRGLGLVGALSTTWGAERLAGGKVVWAELARRPPAAG